MYIVYGDLTVANVIFVSNAAGSYGGGLFTRYGAPTLAQSPIPQQPGNARAAGVYNRSMVITMTDIVLLQ
jgi:hypothetical protein